MARNVTWNELFSQGTLLEKMRSPTGLGREGSRLGEAPMRRQDSRKVHYNSLSKKARFGSAAASLLMLALAGCGSGTMAPNITPPPAAQNASFAFVSNTNSNNISVFQIDESTGKMAPVVGSPFPVGDSGPEFLAVDPSHKFLFVGNSGSNTVSAFQINAASGALTSVPGSPFASGTRPEGVAVDPMGRFVFVSNQGANTISVFALSSSGTLTPVAGSPFPANSPFGLAVNQTGTILYANNFPDSQASDFNTVTAFQIAANGTLTSMAGAAFPTANSAGFASSVGVAIDPGGKFLFVADHMAQAIVPYQISGANGGLTPLSALPAPAPSCNGVACHNNSLRVTVHPTAKLVYATNVDAATVSAFSLVNGGLSPIMDFTTGQHPYDATFDAAGSFLFVANKVDNTISAFSVNANTGMLTPVAGSPFPAGGQGPEGIVIIPKQ
jgi:6-phosphogluconolactonase